MENKNLFGEPIIKRKARNKTFTLFSELFQAKTMVITFGILGITCLISAFWNPWQLMFAAMCGLLVWCGISEYKKVKKHESKKGNERTQRQRDENQSLQQRRLGAMRRNSVERK